MGKCTWLYVLSNSGDEYFYVGMTYRLGTRLREHMQGRGAATTKAWMFDTVQAVYKIDEDRQHDHSMEDLLTLRMMKGRGGAWWKVRGGRWHQPGRIDKPQALADMKEFPEMCMCHYPVAEKVSKSGREFMSCARKDVDWIRETEGAHGYRFPGRSCDYFRWADD
jgi:predicted GIY-YIG superfamily endonuclease